jgi:hypothetical protein
MRSAPGVDPRTDDLSDDPLHSSAYLTFVEQHLAGRLQARVRTAHRGHERAVVVAHEYLDRIPLTFDLATYLRAVGVTCRDIAPRWLVLATPIRFRSTLLGSAAVLADALDALIAEARDDGLGGVVVPWVREGDELTGLLHERGFVSAFYDADWSLETAGHDTLDDLLGALPRGPRKRFVNDRNHFAASGCSIRPWAAHDQAAVVRMHRTFMADHGHDGAELADSAVAAFAELDDGRVRMAVDPRGAPLGFVMTLVGSRQSHVLRWGRTSTPDHARIYANLGYLDPLDEAVATGTERVWFGKSAHRFKSLRGMTPSGASVFALPLQGGGDLPSAMAAADAAYRARFDTLVAP